MTKTGRGKAKRSRTKASKALETPTELDSMRYVLGVAAKWAGRRIAELAYGHALKEDLALGDGAIRTLTNALASFVTKYNPKKGLTVPEVTKVKAVGAIAGVVIAKVHGISRTEPELKELFANAQGE